MREITNMLEEKLLRVKELEWKFELVHSTGYRSITTQLTETELKHKIRRVSDMIDSISLEKECDMIILIESRQEPSVVDLLKKHDLVVS
jgi:hypothetical protein